jgi:hypothetical protein
MIGKKYTLIDQTEQIENDHDPIFKRQFLFDFHEDSSPTLRFKVHDVDRNKLSEVIGYYDYNMKDLAWEALERYKVRMEHEKQQEDLGLPLELIAEREYANVEKNVAVIPCKLMGESQKRSRQLFNKGSQIYFVVKVLKLSEPYCDEPGFVVKVDRTTTKKSRKSILRARRKLSILTKSTGRPGGGLLPSVGGAASGPSGERSGHHSRSHTRNLSEVPILEEL